MQYDLIIRDGTVVDGSGLPRYQADVGIVDGRVDQDWADQRLGQRDHRRRRPYRDAGLYRRPYAYGCPGFLGCARHLLVLAWRHLGRDGQLRLFAGAVRRERQAAGDAQSRTRRGYFARGDGSGNQMVVERLPAISRRGRARRPRESITPPTWVIRRCAPT